MNRRFRLSLKIAGASLGFLTATIVTALFFRWVWPASASPTNPAAIRDLNDTRFPASVGGLFEHRGNLTPSELSFLTSKPLVRGRRALFHLDAFRKLAGLRAGTVADNAAGSTRDHARPVVLNLFPDLNLMAEIHEESTYMVNDGLYTGVIVGDSDSSIRMMIQGLSVDATIIYKGSEYRITDGGSGTVVITESNSFSR